MVQHSASEMIAIQSGFSRVTADVSPWFPKP